MVGQGQYGTRIGHLRVTFDNLGYAMDWSGDSVALTSGFSSDPEIEVLTTHYSLLISPSCKDTDNLNTDNVEFLLYSGRCEY